MSNAGIRAKKKWCENYFKKHPDSRTIEVLGSDDTFPALFDYAFMTGDKDGGNIEQKKRVPHLTFFSEYDALLTPRSTVLRVPTKFDDDGNIVETTDFTVFRTSSDLTNETFQTDAWLI